MPRTTYLDPALADWLGAHVRTFQALGEVPEVVVPDNLKSGVARTHCYEPDLNPSYQELAAHYGVAVIPARVGKPRDKAKVEVGVQVVERWVQARLRHQTFFTLIELNQAIQALLGDLNRRPFKKLPGSRQSQFESLERMLLRPLPAQPYQFAKWKKVRVHIDYHVEVERHYYPATAQLIETILASRPHPQQGFRSCLDIMRLGKDYGSERLEAAYRRALALGATRYKSLQSILKNGLDAQPLPEAEPSTEILSLDYANIRGPEHYQ